MSQRSLHIQTILIFIVSLDASRLFYFPLTKLHSTDLNSQSDSSIVQQSSEAEKIISSDDLDSRFDIERKRNQKRYIYDWQSLIDEEEAEVIKRLLSVNDRSYGQFREHEYKRKPMKMKFNHDDETETVIDRLSQLNENHAINEPWTPDPVTSRVERLQSNTDAVTERKRRRNDALFLIVVGTCSLIGVIGLLGAVVFWYKIQQRAETAVDSDYSSYGLTKTNEERMLSSSTMSDRKLAQSTQRFHYLQQRQQMMDQEKDNLNAKRLHSDESEDETPAGGDYTVYECPGLAPTGEMEVRNPLFSESDSSHRTPSRTSYPSANNYYPQSSNLKGSASTPQKRPST